MKKLIGLVAAVAVLGAVVASLASAEEVPSQTPPAATEGSEPAAPESPPAATEGSEAAAPESQAVGICAVGWICVYPWPWFEGPAGGTNCQAPGAHPLGSTKASIQNECLNVAVWMRTNKNAIGCKNPGTSNNFTNAFNELWVGVNGSRC